jgi:hypothetical protein
MVIALTFRDYGRAHETRRAAAGPILFSEGSAQDF